MFKSGAFSLSQSGHSGAAHTCESPVFGSPGSAATSCSLRPLALDSSSAWVTSVCPPCTKPAVVVAVENHTTNSAEPSGRGQAVAAEAADLSQQQGWGGFVSVGCQCHRSVPVSSISVTPDCELTAQEDVKCLGVLKSGLI